MSGRNLWIVNHYATHPQRGSSGSRHYSLARELVRRGWSVTILAADSIERSRGRVWSEDVGGVVFRYIRTPPYIGNGLGRLRNMASFASRLLLPTAARGLPRPTLIIGSTVHPLAAWSAAKLARRYRVAFVFEIRDLWPATLIDMGVLSQHGLPTIALSRLERHLCEEGKAIITPLPNVAEYLAQIGVPAAKVNWISNGADVSQFSHRPAAEHATFTFGYLGSMGPANGLDTMLQGFAQHAAAVASTRLVLTGDGPLRSDLMQLAENHGLSERVAFELPVPKAQVPSVAARADCLVVNLLDLPVYRYGISLNKIFDYLAAGRPVIIATSARNNPVADADAGLTIPADDARAIGEAMTNMVMASPESRARWGERARRHAELVYDYPRLGGQLDQLLVDLVEPDYRAGPK